MGGYYILGEEFFKVRKLEESSKLSLTNYVPESNFVKLLNSIKSFNVEKELLESSSLNQKYLKFFNNNLLSTLVIYDNNEVPLNKAFTNFYNNSSSNLLPLKDSLLELKDYDLNL